MPMSDSTSDQARSSAEGAAGSSRDLAAFRTGAARRRLVIAVLGVLLLAIVVVAAAIGASSVQLPQVLQVLGGLLAGNEIDPQLRSIVLDVRLPRIACAALAGGALALAGLLMQAIFRNPLVSPYTLGVSDGASFGASLAIVLSAQAASVSLGRYLTPLLAFVFAMVAMLLVYGISRVVRNSTPTLVLTGVAVGYLFSALVSTIKYVANVQQLPELVFWRMGSLMGLRWNVVAVLLVMLSVCVIVSLWRAWDLNALALGREEALALGVSYGRVQILTFVLATVLTATAVSFTGVIGFVGLISPHVARMLVGSDHRYTIPAAVLFGAVLMLLADTLARTLFAPTEIPVGIVTSFIGVPFFLYLIIRRRRL